MPVYYITGTIHSTEAGSPTALMELAYRLAVDESPYVKNIRDHVITVITPVVAPGAADRAVLELTALEQQELTRLLQAELTRAKS